MPVGTLEWPRSTAMAWCVGSGRVLPGGLLLPRKGPRPGGPVTGVQGVLHSSRVHGSGAGSGLLPSPSAPSSARRGALLVLVSYDRVKLR